MDGVLYLGAKTCSKFMGSKDAMAILGRFTLDYPLQISIIALILNR
jgi:hypothetical protein